MICTDATGRAAEGPFSAGKPHPRNYGSFPRLLGHYVRQQGLFALGEAVRKMTSLPAGRLGLSDRGRLSPHYWADVVVFDPATVADQATFTDPHRYPTGIEWVLVNGQVVIRQGQHTGAKPGVVV
jgi:N-acyl-D-amino-acid deacylase